MAWTPYQLFLAGLMVVTGSINTLSTKWADRTKVVGIDDGAPREFNHPFLQACGMFIGEILCIFAFFIIRLINRRRENFELNSSQAENNTKFNPFIFLPPALCDMTATSLMYVGLTLTLPSSFQMLRGAVIIFTGLLSVAFLGRVLKSYEWLGMVIVMAGLAVVGASDFISSSQDSHDINGIITGDLLIIIAQVIAATQMVVEEKFVTKHNVPPLLAVGCEGLFGFIILSILLIPMYYIKVGRFSKNPEHRLEDALDGFVQLGRSWEVMMATFGNILSIAFFNFAGISVTKEISATTRMVLDSVRTLIIWIASLLLLWQTFFYLQVIGFILLIIGMCIYNDIIIAPFLRKKGIIAGIPADNTPIVQKSEVLDPSIEHGAINSSYE